MSNGGCSGPGVCGGARRRPPPPPEPVLSLTADLSELSLDQGYHTLADCGPPRRRRENTISDALWLKILSYLEVRYVSQVYNYETENKFNFITVLVRCLVLSLKAPFRPVALRVVLT